ncbi:MAG: cell envelope biogenesis protein TolA, partial [Candidatus Fonsibacter sp.]|nr:cell envelope biogenesis protein TolA [Candidatus Fonsibacter sp.]
MQKSLKISFIAHFLILVLSSLALPFLVGKVQVPVLISVDLVQIGDRTNLPYAPKVTDGEKTDKKIKDKVVTNQAPPKIIP